MNNNHLFLLALAVFLTACGSNDQIPSYSLPTDLSLRHYQGNERASFAISGQYFSTTTELVNIDGEIDLQWLPNDANISAIPALANVTLLTEQWNSDIVERPEFFLQRRFWQQNDGQLVYAGFTLERGGNTYWTAPTGDTQPSAGIATIGDPDPQPPAATSYDLWLCNNGSCTDKVATVSESYTYRGTDKIQTLYARFETLRYDSRLTITGITNPQLDLDISGPTWIYPPLGPVKFSWIIADSNSSTVLSTASLVSTNIPLPTPDPEQ